MRAILVVLLFSLSAEAAPKNERKPANRMPTKVFTLACRGEDSDTAIALVRVTLDVKDPANGLAAGTFYVREPKGYRAATVNGRYTRVGKDDVVLTLREGFSASYEIFLDPGKESSVPSLTEKQSCEVTGTIESS